MINGSQLVAAIEFALSKDVRSAQTKYETSLDNALQEVLRKTGTDSLLALKLTIRQIRTIRQSERTKLAVEILRTNFPELEGRSPEDLSQLLTEILEIDKNAGRAELMRVKIMRSNIHTVLKPLDPEWNQRFGIGQMQAHPSEVQAKAAVLLNDKVENERQFEIWQSKVFELFVDALVFKGFANSDRKPIGTIDPGQLRQYRRNWNDWCQSRYLEVLMLASQKSIEELTENRTRSYNLNAELRRQARLQQSIYLEKFKADYKEIRDQVRRGAEVSSPESLTSPSQANALVGYKITLRNVDQNLEAEKNWSSQTALLEQLGNWLTGVLGVWNQEIDKVSFTLVSTFGSEISRMEFKASSYADALKKVTSIVSLSS